MKLFGCLAIIAMLAGCAPFSDVPPTPTEVDGPQPILLPGEDEVLPAGVATVGGWVGTSSFPSDYDSDALHVTPEAVAESLVLALKAGYASGQARPVYDLSAVDQQGAGRTLLVVTETGLADDSIAGSQYAVVAEETPDGWQLAELYVRALCTRGASDGTCT